MVLTLTNILLLCICKKRDSKNWEVRLQRKVRSHNLAYQTEQIVQLGKNINKKRKIVWQRDRPTTQVLGI